MGCGRKPHGLWGSVSRRDGAAEMNTNRDAQRNHHPCRQQRTVWSAHHPRMGRACRSPLQTTRVCASGRWPGKKPDGLIGLRGPESHRIRLNSGGTGQAELGKVMKVVVSRIHRYMDRHPGNDRYGCERHPVSEPPRSDEAGWKRRHGSRTDATCLFWQEGGTRRDKPSGFHRGNDGPQLLNQREKTETPIAFRLTMAAIPMNRPPAPPSRLSTTVESIAFFVTPCTSA